MMQTLLLLVLGALSIVACFSFEGSEYSQLARRTGESSKDGNTNSDNSPVSSSKNPAALAGGMSPSLSDGRSISPGGTPQPSPQTMNMEPLNPEQTLKRQIQPIKYARLGTPDPDLPSRFIPTPGPSTPRAARAPNQPLASSGSINPSSNGQMEQAQRFLQNQKPRRLVEYGGRLQLLEDTPLTHFRPVVSPPQQRIPFPHGPPLQLYRPQDHRYESFESIYEEIRNEIRENARKQTAGSPHSGPSTNSNGLPHKPGLGPAAQGQSKQVQQGLRPGHGAMLATPPRPISTLSTATSLPNPQLPKPDAFHQSPKPVLADLSYRPPPPPTRPGTQAMQGRPQAAQGPAPQVPAPRAQDRNKRKPAKSNPGTKDPNWRPSKIHKKIP